MRDGDVAFVAEQNEPPSVRLTATQDSGVLGSKVSISAGNIIVQATVTNPNTNDSLTLDWSMTATSLVDLDSSNTSFTFDPLLLLPGVYKVAVKVYDDATVPLSDYQHILINIVESLPALSNTADSDGDGIDDATEGYADTDYDGIPDYLDSTDQVNVLPMAPGSEDGYLAESDTGIRMTLGRFARLGEHGGMQLTDTDLEVIEGLSTDPDYANVVGIFDFEAHDLPDAGQTVRFVLPLRDTIPADAVYRKFNNMHGGWTTFFEDSNNRLSSTLGEAGTCPPPGDTSWSPGLTEGHWCVQIEIEDGGVNDEDGEANRVIVDPCGECATLNRRDYEC